MCKNKNRNVCLKINGYTCPHNALHKHSLTQTKERSSHVNPPMCKNH